MKCSPKFLLVASATCLLTISAQAAPQVTADITTDTGPAKPLPAWTEGDAVLGLAQQVRVKFKRIEITRPLGAADIPAEPYERKFTEDQFEAFMADLAQAEGTTIRTAPSISACFGESASLQIIRELTYALPQHLGKDRAFVTENVGLTSCFLAHDLKEDGIELKHFTRISELDHFTETDQPMFKRRDVESSSTISDGDIFIIGGIIDEASRQKGEALPKIDINELVSRELIIAITLVKINPDGSPMRVH